MGAANAQEMGRSACDTKSFASCLQKPTYGSSASEIKNYIDEKVSLDEQSEFKRGIFEIKMNCNGEIYGVRKVNAGLTAEEEAQIRKALLEMPKWKPAQREASINYQFYLDLTFRKGEVKVNTYMQ